MKYRKKPITVDATQWFRNGDHPDDGNDVFIGGEFAGEKCEGLVVRYFRNPGITGTTICSICKRIMHVHGFIETLEGGHIVCPGDWIITGVNGEYYPCKPGIFEKTYEQINQPPSGEIL